MSFINLASDFLQIVVWAQNGKHHCQVKCCSHMRSAGRKIDNAANVVVYLIFCGLLIIALTSVLTRQLSCINLASNFFTYSGVDSEW